MHQKSLRGYLGGIVQTDCIHRSCRYIMKQLNMEVDESRLDEMMKIADKDNDGTVSYREFVILLMKK